MKPPFLPRRLGLERFHFVGIGGAGMSGLAEVLARSGCAVSGSDLHAGAHLDKLRELGVRVEEGHRADHLGDAQAVVFSTAIASDNAELREAARRGLPVAHRSEVLAELMRTRVGIAVSGTHGKTTTSAMLALLLMDAGLDPTALIGAGVPRMEGNALLGEGDCVVAEADESDRSFLRLPAVCAVVTNIDLDHMDVYRDLEDLREAFVRFLNQVPFYGRAVACLDDPELARALEDVRRPTITYGIDAAADVTARGLVLEAEGSSFECFHGQRRLGTVRLAVPGKHNVSNALAALAVACWLRVPFSHAAESLAAFRGARRRLELRGERGGVRVVDDYAHHPTEIRATLEAASRSGRRLMVVFQPHRFSRTRHLTGRMGDCFELAERVFVMDVYAAGEAPLEGVDGGSVAAELGPRARYVADRGRLLSLLERETRRGDTLLTLGAGDVWKIGEDFLGD